MPKERRGMSRKRLARSPQVASDLIDGVEDFAQI
jgi:hypothetical protein